MSTPPTGSQVELRHGDQVAQVVQVGGGLRSYEVGGRPVLDGYPADARPDGGRGQVLAPWPNRIRDGRYSFEGAEQQLALTEVAKHNAIHGLVRWSEWQVVGRAAASAELAVRVWPQPGYPFHLEVRATYALGDDGLHVDLVGTNAGDVPLPFAIGQHPYLAVDGIVDDAVLTVPADEWVRCDERGLPQSTERVDGTPYDFREGRRIRDAVLDTPYTSLRRDSAGRVAVRVTDPDGTHGAQLWGGADVAHLQVFTGDTLAPDRRRRGVAVEPMTAAPDAFNSGKDLVRLEPGASHRMTWGLRAW